MAMENDNMYQPMTTLNPNEVQALATQLKGQIIRPGNADYDEARAVWNGMIDKYPALIARCASVEDVVASVNFAREHGLVLAVRGGGHNVAGHATCDGGLVIDLSPMKRITVDPKRALPACRVVQPGAKSMRQPRLMDWRPPAACFRIRASLD